jgi:hypothetical protein
MADLEALISPVCYWHLFKKKKNVLRISKQKSVIVILLEVYFDLTDQIKTDFTKKCTYYSSIKLKYDASLSKYFNYFLRHAQLMYIYVLEVLLPTSVSAVIQLRVRANTDLTVPRERLHNNRLWRNLESKTNCKNN